MKILLSYPNALINEAARINLLMSEDFDVFHLRKPNWTKEEVKLLLKDLNTDVLKKTALHQNHDLAKDFGIQRLHFTSDERVNLPANQLEALKRKSTILSTSTHSVEEYLALSSGFDYAFLSPVFDSISKENYKAIHFDLSIKNPNVAVVALGGINQKNSFEALSMDFDGVAMLGSIWKNYDRPIVLSIGGFDPSGGAGVLADTKTFEQHNCLGFAVQSAITVQTEDQFLSVNWISYEKIIEQLSPLLAHYSISTIKIGLIENLEVLNQLLHWLKQNASQSKIIWDPILTASAGKIFHTDVSNELLKQLLNKVDLITPNSEEVKLLAKQENASRAADDLSRFTNVLLKGGHRVDALGQDVLIDKNGSAYVLEPKVEHAYSKHGSGCVLSAAITSNIALEHTLYDSCVKAKRYIEKVLNSNKNLLAYHVG